MYFLVPSAVAGTVGCESLRDTDSNAALVQRIRFLPPNLGWRGGTAISRKALLPQRSKRQRLRSEPALWLSPHPRAGPAPWDGLVCRAPEMITPPAAKVTVQSCDNCTRRNRCAVMYCASVDRYAVFSDCTNADRYAVCNPYFNVLEGVLEVQVDDL